MYREADPADAQDLYGRSKHLGEVDYPHAVTLRTSIIGHELRGAHGLVGWFLAQSGRCRATPGPSSPGLPTVELARVIRDHVLPRHDLRGVYHVSAAPIAKHDLLQLVATEYGRANEIVPDERVVIDRSLDSSRFRAATGYAPPPWPELVGAMRRVRLTRHSHLEETAPCSKTRSCSSPAAPARSAMPCSSTFCNRTWRKSASSAATRRSRRTCAFTYRSDKLKFYIGDVRDYDSVHDALHGVGLRLPRGGAQAGAVLRVLSDGGGAHQRARRRERDARGHRQRRARAASC